MSELEAILKDQTRRDVLLHGFGTGNIIQLGNWYQDNFNKTGEMLFVQNFFDFLLTKAEGKSDEEAKSYAQAAFNVFSSVNFVLMDKEDTRLVYPNSRFEQDLGFRKVDFGKLFGKLKYAPEINGFYDLKRVVNCIDCVSNVYLENVR